MLNNSETQIPALDSSQKAEITYTLLICAIGIPINLYAAFAQISYICRSQCETHRRFLLKFSIQLTISNLITLICYITNAIWIYTFVWHGGWFLCKFHKFMSSLGYHLWSNMVAAIGFDLLICIKAPMVAYFHANKRVNLLVLLTWSLAILSASPTAIVMGTVQYPDTEYVQCYFQYDDESLTATVYSAFETITQFYLPMLAICSFYGLVIVNYRAIVEIRREILRENWRIHNNVRKKSTSLNQDPKGPLILTSVAIVGTYIFTWLPYQTLVILRELCSHKESQREQLACSQRLMAYEWLEAIRLSCTIINPFLYRFLTRTTEKQVRSRRSGLPSENLPGLRSESGSSVLRFCLLSNVVNINRQLVAHKGSAKSELSVIQKNDSSSCGSSSPSVTTQLLSVSIDADRKPTTTTYMANGKSKCSLIEEEDIVILFSNDSPSPV